MVKGAKKPPNAEKNAITELVEGVTLRIRVRPHVEKPRNSSRSLRRLSQNARCKGLVEVMYRLKVRTASRPLDPDPHSRSKPQKIRPEAFVD